MATAVLTNDRNERFARHANAMHVDFQQIGSWQGIGEAAKLLGTQIDIFCAVIKKTSTFVECFKAIIETELVLRVKK